VGAAVVLHLLHTIIYHICCMSWQREQALTVGLMPLMFVFFDCAHVCSHKLVAWW
jgi:hypothetical protein